MLRFHYAVAAGNPTVDAMQLLAADTDLLPGFALQHGDPPAATAQLAGQTATFTVGATPADLRVAVDLDDLPAPLRGDLYQVLGDRLAGCLPAALLVVDLPGDVSWCEELSGHVCSKCGQPVPAPTDEMRRLAAAAGVPLVIDHDVCPTDVAAAPPPRQFAVRVDVVELAADDAEEAELFFRFTHTVTAAHLADAMRPLAEGLGEKWMTAEKQAHIADPAAGGA